MASRSAGPRWRSAVMRCRISARSRRRAARRRGARSRGRCRSACRAPAAARVERGLGGGALAEHQHAQRALAGAQRRRGEPARPGQLLHERAVLGEHGQREVADERRGPRRRGDRRLRAARVLARGRTSRARQLQRDHHVLQRRAQEPPSSRSTVRSSTSETSVRRSRSSPPSRRAGRRRSRGRRERSAAFGQWSHEKPSTALRAPARQPIGRHSSRAGGWSGVRAGERRPLGLLLGPSPSRARPP